MGAQWLVRVYSLNFQQAGHQPGMVASPRIIINSIENAMRNFLASFAPKHFVSRGRSDYPDSCPGSTTYILRNSISFSPFPLRSLVELLVSSHRVTQLRTDGVQCQELAGTGPHFSRLLV